LDNLILSVLKKQGKSQAWLSRAAGINRTHLHKIIAGKVPNMRVSTAVEIARALGVSVEKLWRE